MTEWAWAVGGLVVAFTLSLALNRFERTSTGKRLSVWIEGRRERYCRVHGCNVQGGICLQCGETDYGKFHVGGERV